MCLSLLNPALHPSQNMHRMGGVSEHGDEV